MSPNGISNQILVPFFPFFKIKPKGEKWDYIEKMRQEEDERREREQKMKCVYINYIYGFYEKWGLKDKAWCYYYYVVFACVCLCVLIFPLFFLEREIERARRERVCKQGGTVKK